MARSLLADPRYPPRMRFLHSMIRVGDLDAALDFFVDKLGMIERSRGENRAEIGG